jgi:hypothetical protein
LGANATSAASGADRFLEQSKKPPIERALQALDAIVLEAGGTQGFVADSPAAQARRDRYYAIWRDLYSEGDERFPRENFDALIAELRRVTAQAPELARRLDERSDLGASFQLVFDASSSGLELKEQGWADFLARWKKELLLRSGRLRALPALARDAEVRRLERELLAEINVSRAAEAALSTSDRHSRAQRASQLRKQLAGDSRLEELAAFLVHESVFGESAGALRLGLDSKNADEVLIAWNELQARKISYRSEAVSEALQVYLKSQAIPKVALPELRLDRDGKPLETEGFRVKTRMTRRGALVPEGRRSRSVIELVAIPRRIHGVFKGIAARECVGGWSCDNLLTERWGTIALARSQLHLVVENGRLTSGFVHGVPVRVQGKPMMSLDIEASALNRVGIRASDTGTVQRVSLFSLWLKRHRDLLPEDLRKMIVGSSSTFDHGGNRAVLDSSPAFVLGRSRRSEPTRGRVSGPQAELQDSAMRAVLLKASPAGVDHFGYGGEIITESTVHGSGALIELLPELESLSDSAFAAAVDRGRPELRARVLERFETLIERRPEVARDPRVLKWGVRDSDPKVRREVSKALARCHLAECGEFISSAAHDSDFLVRYHAILALRDRPWSSDLEALLTHGLADGEPLVRSGVVEVIQGRTESQALEFFVRALGDSHPVVQWNAIQSAVMTFKLEDLPLSGRLAGLRDAMIGALAELSVQENDWGQWSRDWLQKYPDWLAAVTRWRLKPQASCSQFFRALPRLGVTSTH